MRKITITILLNLLSHAVFAVSWHAVNIDYKTIAAMGASYGLEYAAEYLTTEAMDSVASHYKSAALAMAGIYKSKKNDRDAMRNPGLLAAEESYYYKRIYSLVKDGIMPKFITVAAGMVKYPENALYWGPYLYKTTTNVENLCKEFELLCTNGKLSFKDIQFLVINEKLSKLFNLAHLGDMDWKTLLKKMGDFGKDLSKDDIKDDMNRMGNILAQAGSQAVNSNLQKFSKIGNIFHSTPDEVWQMYDQFRNTYKAIKDGANVKDILLGVIGTPDVSGVAKLFQVDDYNITGYISNYIKHLQDQYYTQRWYIYTEDSGSKQLADYEPAKPDNRDNEDEWPGWIYKSNYRKDGKVPDFPKLSTEEFNQLKKAAENATGWNDTRKAEYEANNPGHIITLSYGITSYDYVWDKSGGLFSHSKHKRGRHYTVYMTVMDSWYTKLEMYEETFDSQDMDLDAFISKMKVKMNRMQMDADDDETSPYHGHTFKMESDAPKYYEMADERKMQGCNSVSFIANCNDGANLAEGTFSWKENGKQGKSLEDPKSKEFAMRVTGSSDNNSDTELLSKQQEYTGTIASLQSQIAAKEDEMSELVDKIYAAKQAKNETFLSQLQSQYDTLDAQVASLKSELAYYQGCLEEVNTQLDAYYEDMEDGLDGAYRIPSNMTELQSMYRLQWQDDGEWVNGSDEYIFTRHAYCPATKCVVTYTATLKLSRKPSYFLGIRIHRAILSVEFKLSASGSSENVVEVMQLDMSKTEQQRAYEVNAKMKELMEDMPDCNISVKYEYANSVEESTDDEDGIHLLWASDRLDVARYVEAELTKIYAQLVFIEHVMTFRQGIVDFLKHQILDVVKRGQRGTLALYALEKWQDASAKAMKTHSKGKPDLEKYNKYGATGNFSGDAEFNKRPDWKEPMN